MASKKKDTKAQPKDTPVIPVAAVLKSEPVRSEANGLEAMVNEKTRHGTVLAFSGVEYVRYEYRRVPKGFEEQAKAHPYLDTRACLSALLDVSGDEDELVIEGGAAPEEEAKDETANPEGSDVTDVTDETDTETADDDNAGAETNEE